MKMPRVMVPLDLSMIIVIIIVFAMGGVVGYGIDHCKTPAKAPDSPLPTFEAMITVSSNAPKYQSRECLWILAPDRAIFCHGSYVVDDVAEGPGFEVASGGHFAPLMYQIMRGSDIGPVWVSQMDVENVYIRPIEKKEAPE